MSGIKYIFLLIISIAFTIPAAAQTLTLKSAIDTALANYGTIRAKSNYLKASQASVRQAISEYLPNLNIGAQQAYGTANGQFGPTFGFGGLNVASSGPPLPGQSWNAAFGALYLANINWDFFTFGRTQQRIKLARSQVSEQSNDLEQEKFQHGIRVASAYLNLLAAQRLKITQQKNLERATSLLNVVVARTKNGLNPGVDSSLAKAEVSNAKIALTNAEDYVADQTAQLALLMGTSAKQYALDTQFVSRIPQSLYDTAGISRENHPTLKFFRSRIESSRQQEKYFSRFKYPVFSLVGIYQSRASGFHQHYNELNPYDYTKSYWDGVSPSRQNYLVGMGVTWSLTNIRRIQHQLAAQQFTSRGLEDELSLVNDQLNTQLSLADQKIKNALSNSAEAPVQLKAASDAYLQKSVLYKNGLATIVDITQALFTLNRAEIDREISFNNVWQALLLKAAATGDFNLFIKEF